jgi:hypothetical protein
MDEGRVVRSWAWVTAMQENPSLQKYHLMANESLVFAYLDSQEMLTNPKTVGEALTFALQHGNRLENGTELCVKAGDRLVREAAEKTERDRKAQEEADKLARIAAENEVFKLCKEISEWRGGSDKHAVKQELARISRWTLAELRDYKAGIDRKTAAKGLSASEYKAQIHKETPQAETFNGFPILPAKWNREAIRTAPVATLKHLIHQYGQRQLDTRLQAEEN